MLYGLKFSFRFRGNRRWVRLTILIISLFILKIRNTKVVFFSLICYGLIVEVGYFMTLLSNKAWGGVSQSAFRARTTQFIKAAEEMAAVICNLFCT